MNHRPIAGKIKKFNSVLKKTDQVAYYKFEVDNISIDKLHRIYKKIKERNISYDSLSKGGIPQLQAKGDKTLIITGSDYSAQVIMKDFQVNPVIEIKVISWKKYNSKID